MEKIEEIVVVGDELAMRWQGGREDYLKLAYLRQCCPCAACQGEPDALGRVVKPTAPSGPGSDLLRRYEFVGGYAVQLYWADGHSTGIYSFDYLRQIADDQGH